MEFMIMLGASIGISIILLATLTHFYKDRLDVENGEIAKEVLTSIESELFLATKVEPGYIRSFEIPLTLNGENYNLSIQGEYVVLTYNNVDFVGVSPNITGTIDKGVNTIRNIDGRICLNLEAC